MNKTLFEPIILVVFGTIFYTFLSFRFFKSFDLTSKKPVLKIHLILMRIRILILDPHRKKMDPDPDPGHLFKIYCNFLTKNNFQIFVLSFSLIFILKLDEPFRNEEIF